MLLKDKLILPLLFVLVSVLPQANPVSAASKEELDPERTSVITPEYNHHSSLLSANETEFVKTAHLFVGETPLIKQVGQETEETTKSPSTKTVKAASTPAPTPTPTPTSAPEPIQTQETTEEPWVDPSGTPQGTPEQTTPDQAWVDPTLSEQTWSEQTWSEQTWTDPTWVDPSQQSWNGPVLNRTIGTISGPSGKESYYNLNMNGVIANARNAGIEGDYWVREDGAKMLGNYVMAACDVSGAVHNRYDIVSSSLGDAICVDTGTFAYSNPYQIDLATTW